MAAPGLGPPNFRVSTQENKGASAFERFDGGPNEMTLAEAKEAYAKVLPIR